MTLFFLDFYLILFRFGLRPADGAGVDGVGGRGGGAGDAGAEHQRRQRGAGRRPRRRLGPVQSAPDVAPPRPDALFRTSHPFFLPSFTEFYRVLPGFTGFYRVSQGFTRFYRVFLNRT